MTIAFAIQASNPRSLVTHDPEDTTLNCAIQTVFPLSTEKAIVIWNGVYVPLGYKYDVSILATDILSMLRQLQASARGSFSLTWPSNSFSATWSFDWANDVLRIRSEWSSVIGGVEALLNGRPYVATSKRGFISEWKSVLERVRDALYGAGYRPNHLAEMADLESVLATIEGDGIFYRTTEEE